MKNNSEDIIKLLKAKKFRITEPRKAIIELITEYPVTTADILEKLKKKHIFIDIASVYRTIKILCDLQVIQKITFGDGKKRFELKNIGNPHHHLVCEKCGSIEDIILDMGEKLIEKIFEQSQFKINSHIIEFFGLCPTCKN